MTVAIAPPLTSAGRDDALPNWLGWIGGFALPMVAAALYATYDISVRPLWLEETRQLGHVWLLGELTLILYAVRLGFTLRAAWTRLPRWAQVALALFLSTFWISSAFVSQHPAFSLGLTIGWALQLLFAAALAHLVVAVPVVRLADVWHGFALGLVGLTIAIAVHFIFLPALLRGQEYKIEWVYAIPGFISVRLFGSWCGAILAFLTGVVWLNKDTSRLEHILHLAFSLAFGLMIWSGTRAAVLGWIFALLVAWLVAGRPQARAATGRLPIYLLIAACLAIFLQPYHNPAFTFFDVLDPDVNRSADSFSSGRLTFWRLALDVARQRALFGFGAGSCWWEVHLTGQAQVQPHNAVVQFLLNWGIVPTLPALALLAGGTWNAHRNAQRVRGLLPFVLMLDCLLAMSLLDGMLHFAQFVMLIVACLSICLAPRDTPRALDR